MKIKFEEAIGHVGRLRQSKEVSIYFLPLIFWGGSSNKIFALEQTDQKSAQEGTVC